MGTDGRDQQLPLKQLQRLGAFPAECNLSQWIGQPGDSCPSSRDCASAWLLLQGSDEPLPFREWAELVSGQDSLESAAACWRWLIGNQLFFRSRASHVEPIPLEEIRHLRLQRRRQVLREKALLDWHLQLAARKTVEQACLDSGALADLALLHQWAAGVGEPELPAPLKQGLKAAHCPLDSGAIRHLLVDLGSWNPHQLPSLQGSVWELGFSPELQQEASRILEQAHLVQPGDAERLDLTGLRSFTIDDESTRDIDDGLSLETGKNGSLKLWIHVADPGRLIAPGSPLDLEARRRGSSLYLAQGNLPMFPLELSTGPFSLRCGQRSAAWSLAVELAEDGAIGAFELHRSWVKPTYRLTYEDADELIELAPPQEQELLLIHGLLLKRRQWRLNQGALLLDQPEGRIREQEGLPVLEITEPGASRSMVAEAMILAGAAVAEWGREKGLAMPYRSQLPAELPPDHELDMLPPGPVRHAAIKRCLSRGLTGTEAAAHFSLGLPAYVQATSPIRRYGDLVVQRQLGAQLGGAEPLAAEEMELLLKELDGAVRQGISIAREDHRHWQQVWFDAHSKEQWQGVFLRWLRPQDGLGLVHVEDLAMDLAALCPQGCDPGDGVSLKVSLVDPLRDQLRLEARR
ncbi:ribonuclease catalytic domain-containing protein [Cyanobium sp. WAJ14-Wanaka]|uniref:ribonuclease catalytic domain-containing protein n=1 Tax=Cyanobium sp. WAJ14-Wanaka TaxID=2823725 RepID=UPI0020CE920F|nr:RNB domain-containing ribonuclease [Cyanobium sp. WAJ14-Wanaka]